MAELASIQRVLTEKPDFKRYVIEKADDGTYSVTCEHAVGLFDGETKIADLPSVSFGLSQAQLIADPNYPAVFLAIKSSARAGLASVRPELVTP